MGGLQVLFPLLEQVQYSEETEGKIARHHSLPSTANTESISTTEISISNDMQGQHRRADFELSTSPFDFNHFGDLVRPPSAEQFMPIEPAGVTDERGAVNKSRQTVANDDAVEEQKSPVSLQPSTVFPEGGHSTLPSAGSFLVIESRCLHFAIFFLL